MKTTCLKLASIVTTAGTQIRARIDNDTVGEYADSMQDATNKFPPVVVFHDGNQFILADGFHRVMAASRNGFTDIEAEVRKGTKTDALRYALSANSVHGLKRTNADKRRCVELALTEWPELSDRNLAELCAVGHPFVGDVRKQLEPDSSSIPAPATRTGMDGKKRKVKTKAPVAQTPAPDWEARANERLAARTAAAVDDEDMPFDAPKPSTEFVKRVEREFHKFMDKFEASELPEVRRIVRTWIARD